MVKEWKRILLIMMMVVHMVMMMYSGAMYGRRLVHFLPLRQIVALATDFVKQAILRIITILL